jgi:hypothetical protein
VPVGLKNEFSKSAAGCWERSIPIPHR